MKTATLALVIPALLIVLNCCVTTPGRGTPVDAGSSAPAGTVTLRGETLHLAGTPLRVGEPFPATTLIDAFTLKEVDLSLFKGKVLVVSVVPSLDTRVCEAQTHYLGEPVARLPADVVRITISRDTPFAQKRFAEEAGLTGITYLSDYRDGSFGRATGLLQKVSMLLGRAVIVADREGIVRYIQVVPELTHLPDMESAFRHAEALSAAGK